MSEATDTAPRPFDPIPQLRDEFRRHLETFYAKLKLAPPYHSVEKAVLQLATTLKALPPAERDRIAADPELRWARYAEAFTAAGLNQKHRGIIVGLARSRQALDLPKEYDRFLDAFMT
jgi:hypothetical protein